MGKGAVFSSKVHTVLKGSDGSIKLQIELVDGCMVETVLLVDREGRKTACVSSQAGCAMGCRFCKTGSLGFARNFQRVNVAFSRAKRLLIVIGNEKHFAQKKEYAQAISKMHRIDISDI